MFSPRIEVFGPTWEVICIGIELINKDHSVPGLGYAKPKFIPLRAKPHSDRSSSGAPQDWQGLRVLLDTGEIIVITLQIEGSRTAML